MARRRPHRLRRFRTSETRPQAVPLHPLQYLHRLSRTSRPRHTGTANSQPDRMDVAPSRETSPCIRAPHASQGIRQNQAQQNRPRPLVPHRASEKMAKTFQQTVDDVPEEHGSRTHGFAEVEADLHAERGFVEGGVYDHSSAGDRGGKEVSEALAG